MLIFWVKEAGRNTTILVLRGGDWQRCSTKDKN